MNRNVRQIAITQLKTAALVDREIANPPLGPQELTGRTLATLVSAGTELAYFYNQPDGVFPRFPGYAAVFEVEAVGAAVSGFQAGDRALVMGPHASRQRCPADQALKLPPGLAPEQAVCARMVSISLTTLVTTTARPPEIALVTGLGAVGNFAAQNFARAGYTVIGVDPSPLRQAAARACGIADVRARTPLDENTVTGHVGVAVECSGHEQAVLDSLSVVKKRGEVVLVGVPWAPRTALTAQAILSKVFHQYAVLRSGWEWELPNQPTAFQAHSIFGNLRAALDGIATGVIVTAGLCAIHSPTQAPAVYAALDTGQTDKLIQVFNWSAISQEN